MKASDIKYIKLNKKQDLQIALQNWIIKEDISNAGLISIGLHRCIRKFLNEVEKIPLSEELQQYDK